MQTITKAEVIAAARAYYEKGQLTAQQEEPKVRKCKYKVNGFRCAVGACLSEETLEMILSDSMNERGVSVFWGRFLTAENDDVKVFVEDLQFCHDRWCRRDTEDVTPLETKFCEMIGIEPKEKRPE